MTIDKGKKKCLPVRTPTPKKICREEASNANTDDDFVDEHPVLCGKTLAVIDIPEGSKRKGNNSSKRDKCQSVRVARSASNKDEKSKEKEKRKKMKNPKGVQCKRRRVRKKEETGDESSQKDEKYPKLNTRSTPAAFFKKLRDLNEAQREAVHAIGFGRILEFTIKDVPSRLAYWVLDKYNSRTGCLEIDGTCKIQIYEDDVYRVFGFPKGEKKIEVFERTEVNELFSEWMEYLLWNIKCK